MTISSTTRVNGPYTSGTALPFTFKVFSTSDMDVIRLNTTTGVETVLVLNSDYTVALNGNQNTNPGGTVNLTVAASATSTVTITSDIANLQPTDLTNQGGFYPEVITDALDRATIQIQQMSEDVGRSLKGPISDGSLNMELPTAAQRANKYLVFDANGLPISSAGSGTDTALRTDLANTVVTTAGAGLVGFRSNDATSVGRTVLEKLRDVVSVKDFGAVGDGTTDDIAAFNLATTYCEVNDVHLLHIPPGRYHLSSYWRAPSPAASSGVDPDSFQPCIVKGYGAILDNTVLFENSVGAEGIRVKGSPDVGFCFTRGQGGSFHNLIAERCVHGFYFGTTSRQNVTVASTTGFAAGQTVLGGTSGATGKIDLISGNVLKLVGCNKARDKTATVTISNASPGVVSWTGHGLVANSKVYFSTTGTLPSPLVAGQTYYVVSPAVNTFNVSDTSGGSAINTTTAGSGTHSAFTEHENTVAANVFTVAETITSSGGGSTTVSATTTPYGTNNQVTRVTFVNCIGYQNERNGWLFDGCSPSTKSWMNANTFVCCGGTYNSFNLSSSTADATLLGQGFTIKSGTGPGGANEANYNTFVGTNVEGNSATVPAFEDRTGRQNTHIGGHFAAGSSTSFSFRCTDALNFMFGGRHEGIQYLGGVACYVYNDDTTAIVGLFAPLFETSGTGSGVKMTSTTTASDANTLDCYVEGTFTPVFTPASGSFTSVTYDVQSGNYTRVGNTVTLNIVMRTSAITVGTATGALTVNGLPAAIVPSSGIANQKSVSALGASYSTNPPTSAYLNNSGIQLIRATGASVAVSDLATGAASNVTNLSVSYTL